jgi:hypothetical protein
VVLEYIVYEDDNINRDSGSMLFLLVASNILKWCTFKFQRRDNILNCFVDWDEIFLQGGEVIE